MFKFIWVTLHVKDVGESLKFYNEIMGLPIITHNKMPMGEIAFLGDENSTQVELIQHNGEELPGSCPGITIGFKTDSVEETIEMLKSHGVDKIRGPISPGPNISFFYATDPDGYEVQFVQRLE